jgi:hypothetical protein
MSPFALQVVLCDAALAFGAPGLTGDEDVDILAIAWRDVVGTDPPYT